MSHAYGGIAGGTSSAQQPVRHVACVRQPMSVVSIPLAATALQKAGSRIKGRDSRCCEPGPPVFRRTPGGRYPLAILGENQCNNELPFGLSVPNQDSATSNWIYLVSFIAISR
ncbi:unnamed protein product [Mesocestoides corti]|uniref:Uncharacterized protein n=1 Tax=Mesocestoides corti TaxID=53468 RepID=A0A0R3ULI1_MESCO|nr:unnamed protein product [Mesocestoides corti]